MRKPSFRKIGDRAVVARVTDEPSDLVTARLVAMANRARAVEGVIDVTIGYRSILVEVPPGRSTEFERLMDDIDWASHGAPMLTAKEHVVPVIYTGEDLDWVCHHIRISKEKFIQIHTGNPYLVRVIASPRFIYLSELSEDISVPRLAQPRREVPAGAVAVAGRQTGIYGLARPGAWRLVGTAQDLPDVFPGEQVRFEQA